MEKENWDLIEIESQIANKLNQRYRIYCTGFVALSISMIIVGLGRGHVQIQEAKYKAQTESARQEYRIKYEACPTQNPSNEQ